MKESCNQVQKYHVLLILLLAAIYSNAQYVTIPDTAFVSWLNGNGYSQCLTGSQLDTTCPAVINATGMSIAAPDLRQIQSIEGVEFFSNLNFLTCSQTSIQTLPKLPKRLKTLYCTNNQINFIGSLPDSLTGFYCYNNKISSLPNLPNTLKYLECFANLITALPALPRGLNTIDCSGNKISVLPTLPDSLQVIYCYGNLLNSLPSLPAGLTHLWCCVNRLTVLPALPAKLLKLQCNMNMITVLPILPDSLQFLDCDHNPLSGLPSSLPPTLGSLWCFNDGLRSLPVLPGTLQELNCDSNLLPTLPPFPGELKTAICSNNLLTGLPALPDSMNTLDCHNNADLHCLPYLNKIHSFIFDSANISCVPNYGHVNCHPPITTFPLCSTLTNNPCQALSVFPITLNAALTIYPNPSSTTLFLKTENIQAQSIIIYDFNGRIVNAIPFKQDIDISELSNGVYFVELVSNESVLRKVFVKI